MSESIDNSIQGKNQRRTARGNYTRWLAHRFGFIDLMSTKEGEDKIALSKIYVPLRLGRKDIDENDRRLKQIDNTNKQNLGDDARKVIVKQNFVAVSGRPGSGKTTLTQALIGELCNDNASEFRNELAKSAKGEKLAPMPVPLILRDYQGQLATMGSFDELLNAWWQLANNEVASKNLAPFSVSQMASSVAISGDKRRLLVVFDGIDEVGGLEARFNVIKLAIQAFLQGHKVVLTGRPTGYQDIDWKALQSELDQVAGLDAKFSSECIYYVQPFSFEQINTFIGRFYRMLDAWQAKAKQGIAQFIGAISDRQRNYLLSLARRPIFLTLMSLVHVNDTQMPDGRADLYKRIIDLYLLRQTQQRQITANAKGDEIPNWDEREIRRTLGYLAWSSQNRIEDDEQRQVVWSRVEMESTLTTMFESGDAGRFGKLDKSHVIQLVDYYLHPAGLLVEPAEGKIQFSHLSFQEYLCAEYVHGRCLAKGMRGFFDAVEQQLFAQLHRPGWDEVGLLFLTIHNNTGEQTMRDAHFELLAQLDFADVSQANLLVQAYSGGELPFNKQERQEWLPLLLALVLCHDNEYWLDGLKHFTDLQLASRELLTDLFDYMVSHHDEVAKESQQVEFLVNKMNIEYFENACFSGLLKLWGELSTQEQFERLIVKVVFSDDWLSDDDLIIHDNRFQQKLADWLVIERPPFYKDEDEDEDEDGTRYQVSDCFKKLNAYVLTGSGPLHEYAMNSLPIDVLITQGELVLGKFRSLPHVFKLLDCVVNGESLYGRHYLAIYLYILLIQMEWQNQSRLISRARERTLLVLLSGLQSRFRLSSQYLLRARSRSLSLITFDSILEAKAKAKAKAKAESGSGSFGELLAQFFLSISLPTFSLARRRSLLKRWLESSNLSVYYNPIISGLEKILIQKTEWIKENNVDELYKLIEQFGLHCAAKDWFEKMPNPIVDKAAAFALWQGGISSRDSSQQMTVEDSIQPDFNAIFYENGMPNMQQSRRVMETLGEWLSKPEAILKTVFPQGLSETESKLLLQDLHDLNESEFSLKNFHSDIMADWPEEQEYKEVTTRGYVDRLVSKVDELVMLIPSDRSEVIPSVVLYTKRNAD